MTVSITVLELGNCSPKVLVDGNPSIVLAELAQDPGQDALSRHDTDRLQSLTCEPGFKNWTRGSKEKIR